MTNELALGAPQLPSLMPDEEARRVMEEVVAFRPDDGSPVALRRPLRNAEKATLQKRVRELHSALRPLSQAQAERARLRDALTVMFIGFPSLRNTDAPTMVTAYMTILEDLPIFAALQACDDVVHRRVKGTDPDFPPTAPRLYEIGKRHAMKVEGERIGVEKTLAGRVDERPEMTPEQREKLAEDAKKFVAHMRATQENERIGEREEVQRRATTTSDLTILREYERLGIDPFYADEARTILLSPELAKTRIAATVKAKRRSR